MKIEELESAIREIQFFPYELEYFEGTHTTSLMPRGASRVLAKIQRLAQEKPILFVPKGWFTVDKKVYALDDEDNATPFFDQVEVIENE